MASKAAESRLDVARGLLAQCVKSAGGFDTPPIGHGLTGLWGCDLADAVVIARLRKHFQVTREVDPVVRRDTTIQKMIDHDQRGLSTFDYRALPQGQRRSFLLAKNQLESFSRHIRRLNSFRFPSGETVHPSQGDTDMIAKLVDGDQWRVSFEAANDAAAILYQTQALRRVVKERFRSLYPHWRFLATSWFNDSKSKFLTFKRMFIACCTIQNYSRLSTVPKNGEIDRPISMEPMFNMMVQLSYAADLRAALKSCYGYDLNTRAQLHRTLIRHPNKVTIDLKNASNSNWMAVIRQLWPRSVLKCLERMRTPVCYYKGHFHHYNMLAPMGCGFTFEVMTLTLLHLAWVFDPGATVFGDDIIIEAEAAPAFLELLGSTGWEVNEDKTFLDGNFRESCGGFYDLKARQDIVSYEFHQVKCSADVCTTVNKLRHLIQVGQISTDLKKMLTQSWLQLIMTVPRVAWRSEDDFLTEPLPQGVALVPELWFRQVRSTTVMSLCYSSMYHREVTLGSRYRKRPRDSDVTPSERIQLAAFLRRGVSYTPTLRPSDEDLILEKVICGGDRKSVV